MALCVCVSVRAQANKPGMLFWRDLYMLGPSITYGTPDKPLQVDQLVVLPADWKREISGIVINQPDTWVTFYARGDRSLHIYTGLYQNLRKLPRETRWYGPPQLWHHNWNEEIESFKVRGRKPVGEAGTFCTIDNKVPHCNVVGVDDVKPPPPQQIKATNVSLLNGSVYTLYIYRQLIPSGASATCDKFQYVGAASHNQTITVGTVNPGQFMMVYGLREQGADRCIYSNRFFEGAASPNTQGVFLLNPQ
jgi:hypothetical protein